ncbi:hypothetical protein [Paraburkholderia caballeronis]|uniref:hypothetical protein n=1 Tax=Paraburkholderia caballeronis TaxID=416943 RepID=UPI00106558C2|nr:hypothetical protein [Paraburkholderia caballeronis]
MRRNTSLRLGGGRFDNVSELRGNFRRDVFSARPPRTFMDTHLMIGIAVMMGLIGIAASRDLLRMRRAQLQPVALRSRPFRDNTAARR